MLNLEDVCFLHLSFTGFGLDLKSVVAIHSIFLPVIVD